MYLLTMNMFLPCLHWPTGTDSGLQLCLFGGTSRDQGGPQRLYECRVGVKAYGKREPTSLIDYLNGGDHRPLTNSFGQV